MKAVTRGPVKVIESHGIRIPIYDAPTPSGAEGYLLAYYAEGRRKQERAKTLAAAETAARAKIKELTTGVAHVGTLTPRETAVVAEAIEIARRCNVSLVEAMRQFEEAVTVLVGCGTLADAARHFAAHRAAIVAPEIRFSKLAEKFIQRNEELGLSEVYRDNCRRHLAIFSKAVGTVNVASLRKPDLTAMLNAATGKNSARRYNNLRGTLNALFSFAQGEGYLSKDRKHEASLVEKRNDRTGGVILIYTPSEMETVLRNIPEEMVPWVALSGLAGLRTSEVHRLTWEMIRFESKVIVLEKAFTKTKRRRVIPMCPALIAWLEPYADKGRLYDYSQVHFELLMRRAWAKITGPDGELLVEKKMNGLRHSYGSYRFAILQDENKVSTEMGNSPAELREHYAELALPGDAEKYFSIFPKK